jgi:hypothetical protein
MKLAETQVQTLRKRGEDTGLSCKVSTPAFVQISVLGIEGTVVKEQGNIGKADQKNWHRTALRRSPTHRYFRNSPRMGPLGRDEDAARLTYCGRHPSMINYKSEKSLHRLTFSGSLAYRRYGSGQS